MKPQVWLAFLLILSINFSANIPASKDGQYYLQYTVTKYIDENKPWYAKNRELTRILIEAAQEGKIGSFMYSTHDLYVSRPVSNITLQKRLEVKRSILEELEELDQEEVAEQDAKPKEKQKYSPQQMHFRVVNEVEVKKQKIKESKTLWIDLFVNGKNTTDGIDHYLGSYKYEDCKKLFAEDSRAVWYNPSNNAEKANFEKAIDLKLYHASIISVLDQEGNQIFFSTLEYGGDNVNKADPFIKKEYAALQKEMEFSINVEDIDSKKFIKKFFLQRTIDLNHDRNKPVISGDKNMVTALYEAGSSGKIPIYFPSHSIDLEFNTVEVADFKKNFTTDPNGDTLDVPLEKISKLVLVEEVEVDKDGNKEYKIKYIGLIVPAELTYSGLTVHLGYMKMDDTKDVLNNINVQLNDGDKKSVFEFFKERKFAGTTFLHIADVYGESGSISKEEEKIVMEGEIGEDNLSFFKDELE